MMEPIAKYIRLSDYEKCLDILKKINVGDNSEIGICVLLGDIHCLDFFAAPWTEWHEVIKYYPELGEIGCPKTKRACLTNDRVLQESLNERIEIIKSSIFKIKPKAK